MPHIFSWLSTRSLCASHCIETARRPIKLDEPHAPLHQPPRQQAARAELRRALLIEAVQPPRAADLFREIHRFRRTRLHPERQLVGADPRRHFVVAVERIHRIHLLQEVQRVRAAAAAVIPFGGLRLMIGAGPPQKTVP